MGRLNSNQNRSVHECKFWEICSGRGIEEGERYWSWKLLLMVGRQVAFGMVVHGGRYRRGAGEKEVRSMSRCCDHTRSFSERHGATTWNRCLSRRKELATDWTTTRQPQPTFKPFLPFTGVRDLGTPVRYSPPVQDHQAQEMTDSIRHEDGRAETAVKTNSLNHQSRTNEFSGEQPSSHPKSKPDQH